MGGGDGSFVGREAGGVDQAEEAGFGGLLARRCFAAQSLPPIKRQKRRGARGRGVGGKGK